MTNGLYWQPSTDANQEGNFSNDPEVPNDRESSILSWSNDFATTVIITKQLFCFRRCASDFLTEAAKFDP
jgi:hypothetical protein